MTSLLPAQESHWELMCALAPEAPGASRFVVVDNRFVDARLDLAAMRAAFADVTRRHDALRLVFDDVTVAPELRIEPQVEPSVEYRDLSGLSESNQLGELGELVYREHHRAFDLTTGPTWHAWFVRLGPDRHFLNVCFAEIIADGWASKVFMEDVLTAYAVRIGTAAAPPAPLTFAEMGEVQRARLAPTPERLAHWREQLLPMVRRDLFRTRVHDGTSLLASHRIDVQFEPEVLLALRAIAWRARSTVFVVLMAAYHVLLTAATGQDRTVISTAALGRTSEPERSSLLPCTIDPYVVTTLTPGTTLRAAVTSTHAALAAALAHLVPFTAVARAVNPDFDRQRPWPDMHLCDGNFFAAAFEDHELVVNDMRVRMPRLRSRVPHDLTDLELRAGSVPAARLPAWVAHGGPSMEISHDRDACAVVYNGEVYDATAVRAHLEAYLQVVRTMAAAPDTSVGAVTDRIVADHQLVVGAR